MEESTRKERDKLRQLEASLRADLLVQETRSATVVQELLDKHCGESWSAEEAVRVLQVKNDDLERRLSSSLARLEDNICEIEEVASEGEKWKRICTSRDERIHALLRKTEEDLRVALAEATVHKERCQEQQRRFDIFKS